MGSFIPVTYLQTSRDWQVKSTFRTRFSLGELTKSSRQPTLPRVSDLRARFLFRHLIKKTTLQ